MGLVMSPWLEGVGFIITERNSTYGPLGWTHSVCWSSDTRNTTAYGNRMMFSCEYCFFIKAGVVTFPAEGGPSRHALKISQ
jgi:hypothetical protein